MEQITILQKFKELSEVACKSSSTIKNYWRYIQGFINHYGEHPKQEDIIHYLYYLKLERKLSKSSLNTAKFALIYYYEEILKEQITEKIPRIPRPKSIPKPVHQLIIKGILDVAENEKHRLEIEVSYDTGLRPFELVKLEWAWIDIGNRQGILNGGKFDKDRPFYFSEIVAQHLREWKEKSFKGIRNGNRKYVFFSEQRPDYHICTRSFENVIKQLSEKAGIDLRMYPYRLRHSFCTHLNEDDVPIEKIQPRAGHNSMTTTLKYTKVKRPEGKMKFPMDNPIFKEKKEEVMPNVV